MNFFEVINKRRSYRDFENKDIQDEDLNKIIDAVLKSPTGGNKQASEIIVIKNKETIKKLSDFKSPGKIFLKNAPLNIVVLGDREKFPTYSQDACIAAITIQYAATALGLQSCWANCLNNKTPDGEDSQKYIKNLLNIPDRFYVECVIAIGYPKGEVYKKEVRENRVHFEKID